MEEVEFRNAVLNEVLKLISDKAIEVDGRRLEIKTHQSVGYDPSRLPWISTDDLEPAADAEVSFDTVSPKGEVFPTLMRWEITLVGT
jgi:hypothetical protein